MYTEKVGLIRDQLLRIPGGHCEANSLRSGDIILSLDDNGDIDVREVGASCGTVYDTFVEIHTAREKLRCGIYQQFYSMEGVVLDAIDIDCSSLLLSVDGPVKVDHCEVMHMFMPVSILTVLNADNYLTRAGLVLVNNP